VDVFEIDLLIRVFDTGGTADDALLKLVETGIAILSREKNLPHR
jgi:hypothetical protein